MGKKVVPIVLDDSKLSGWFLFEFGVVDYINIQDRLQKKKYYDKEYETTSENCDGSTYIIMYRFNYGYGPVSSTRSGKTCFNDVVRKGKWRC